MWSQGRCCSFTKKNMTLKRKCWHGESSFEERGKSVSLLIVEFWMCCLLWLSCLTYWKENGKSFQWNWACTYTVQGQCGLTLSDHLFESFSVLNYFLEMHPLCECWTVQCFVKIDIKFESFCFLILETPRIEIADILDLSFILLVFIPSLV